MSIVKQEAKKGNRVNSQAEFRESLKNIKSGTAKLYFAVLNNWELFSQYHYKLSSSELLIQDMLENQNETEGIFQILHHWVKWNLNDKKILPYTVLIYLGCLRKYLHMRGIKIDRADLNEYFAKNDTLVTQLKEKKYPVKLSELQNILGIVPMIRKQLYLVMISSGLRISEALLMRKRDLNFEYARVMITVPAENAKNKEERITFISEEARKICQPLFDSKFDDELIFGTGCSIHDDVTNHAKYFATTRRKLGYLSRYKSGTHKITLHSFRSYFISKIIKENENLGHYLAGHSVYMKQYERFEIEELIDAYIKSEPDLTIIDLTRKDNEIAKLKNSDYRVKELENKVELYHKLILSLGIDPKLLIQKVKDLEIENV